MSDADHPSVTPAPNPTAFVGVKAPKKQEVLVVDDEKSNVDLLQRFLTREGYLVRTASNGSEAREAIRVTMPDILLLDISMPVLNGLSLCRMLRAEFATRSLPIILLTAHNSLEDRLQGLQAGADDYIGKPYDLAEVKARLEGSLQRRHWDQAVNPLTRLPGSPAIEEDVWKRLRLGYSFAFAYLDIDNFKSFNDAYGYEAGDKVIKFVGSLLIDSIRQSPQSSAFAGHIGGDDFALLSATEDMPALLDSIVRTFDETRNTFYRPADIEKGYIETTNRKGEPQRFPLMTLSVAVVSTLTRRIRHYARLVEIASELKRFVKSNPHDGHSLILWDRRQDSEGAGNTHS